MSFTTPTGRRRRGVLFDLLSFDRLLTGPLIHLIYWGGLALVLLSGFGFIGAAVGLALRNLNWEALLLATPAVVAAILTMLVIALLWRAACEFFLAVFSIAENLHALHALEAEAAAKSQAATVPSAAAQAARRPFNLG